ncbi:hypothetical protein Poly30_27660 [Planctomycetes bacterium Poly30]|uniref:Uncharacterized protein n=1 Tax=Saltatorellus ferox TaxID=2528018 RepID=A0A518ET26_9BACT|nr:hypothetical protein Poly30_27660 [Planctomycetes bacterium Poly30]
MSIAAKFLILIAALPIQSDPEVPEKPLLGSLKLELSSTVVQPALGVAARVEFEYPGLEGEPEPFWLESGARSTPYIVIEVRNSEGKTTWLDRPLQGMGASLYKSIVFDQGATGAWSVSFILHGTLGRDIRPTYSEDKDHAVTGTGKRVYQPAFVGPGESSVRAILYSVGGRLFSEWVDVDVLPSARMLISEEQLDELHSSGFCLHPQGPLGHRTRAALAKIDTLRGPLQDSGRALLLMLIDLYQSVGILMEQPSHSYNIRKAAKKEAEQLIALLEERAPEYGFELARMRRVVTGTRLIAPHSKFR